MLPRWSLLGLILLVALISPSSAIYCGDDDCYDLLGLTQKATSTEVRKAFYKLSLQYHPDKNPDPAAHVKFTKINAAYEILFNKETREKYDYALAHPEEFFYNTAQYYRTVLVPKTDTRAILLGVLILLSAFQYLNDLVRYQQAVAHAKQTPAYKNKLKAMEMERSGGVKNRKKGSRNKLLRADVADDLADEVELHIHGAEKPGVWRLILVRLLLLPFTIYKLASWQLCWAYRYGLKKEPYSWQDAEYLTRTSAAIPATHWKSMDEGERSKLVLRRLWVKENLAAFYEDMRKENRRRR